MMRKAVAASGASILALVAGGCHKYDEPPFNPREMGRSARLSARERIIREKPPIPTQLEPRPATRPAVGADAKEFIGDEPTVRLSLQEIIQRTVANNHDVAVAGYEPAIEETRVIEADARFDPAFFSSITFTDERILSPSGGQVLGIDPFSPSGFESLDARVGVRQLGAGGGQFELSYGTRRIRRAEGFDEGDGINPYYVNELLLRVTQPLLRDFGSTINEARITIARNNQRISTLEFRRTLEEQVATVEEAYWELVRAARDVSIQEDLLASTVRTADILQARMIAGSDVTRVQTAQAEAAVASREAVLIRARSRVKDLSDEIKRRMSDPAYPIASPVVVLPATEPLLEPVRFDPAEQFDVALRNRLELGQQQVRIDSAAIALDVARNNVLPQLNLVGQLSFQDAGAEFSDAVEVQSELRSPTGSIGFEFEIPFGNRLARAVLNRARLQRGQAMRQYQLLIQEVELNVSRSLREVDTSWEEIERRRAAVFQAADSLLAIQQRREADEPLTPEFVSLELERQQTLANNRAEEAQAISAYNTAILNLERSKGMLLRYNNIVLQEQQDGRD